MAQPFIVDVRERTHPDGFTVSLFPEWNGNVLGAEVILVRQSALTRLLPLFLQRGAGGDADVCFWLEANALNQSSPVTYRSSVFIWNSWSNSCP